jgi:trigger factor
MQKTVEDINPTKKRFIIEVPADVMENKMVEALRKIGRNTRLPGFRPGKAPISLIYKKYGKDVEAEVFERAVAENYLKAIKEEDVVPIAAPVFEKNEFKRNSPLRMTFTIEIRPEIGELRYEGYVVPDEDIDVTDEEIENTMNHLLAEKSRYDKTDDKIADDDLVIVDYEIVEEEQKVNDQFITVGSEIMPPDISDALRGKKSGDQFEVNTTFPENFMNKNLSGKNLTLKGLIKEVKRIKRPDLNDDFAKDLGYENVEKLREGVRESIKRAKEDALKSRQKFEIVEQLVKNHDFHIPEGLLKEELDMLVAQEKSKERDADEDKLREDLRDKAVRNVKTNLLLDVIAEKENVNVTDDEVKMRIITMANSMYMSPENFVQQYLQSDGALNALRQNMVREKTVDLILQKAVKEKESGAEKTEEEETAQSDTKGEEV